MRVLFVCVHNAGRSQMAEAFVNHLANGRAEARSAGTLGAGHLNPVAVQAMAEVGIDMSGHTPKVLTQELVEWADQVVSMGCGVDAEACPTKFLVTDDWGLDDPAGQDADTVRRLRDEIRTRVERLLDSAG